MIKGSFFKKSLYLLEMIDKNEKQELVKLLNEETELIKVFVHLNQLELIAENNSEFCLTEKGKNVLHYFNKMVMDNYPLIRIE
jgi:hypothetical protein